MQNESIYVDEKFLNYIDVEYEEFCYADRRYVYCIDKKEMHIKSTLCKNLEISDELVEYIFENFLITRIFFHETYDNSVNISKCVIRKSIDDNILYLEDFSCIDEYISTLGKKTRQHLKNYQRVLEREVKENGDDLIIKVYKGKESITEFSKTCEEIFELNKQRCESKGFSATVHEEYIPAYYNMGGYVVYKINEHVVAGTLFLKYGEQMYLSVIAHDNSYVKYNIGNLVLLRTIELAIDSGLREFHFLWGRCDYKARFKSEQRNLYKIGIYKYWYVFLYYWIGNKAYIIFEKIKEEIKPYLLPVYKKLIGMK